MMNKNYEWKTNWVLCLLIVVGITNANAQFDRIAFGLEGGWAINSLSGEVRDDLNDDIDDLKDDIEYDKFRGNVKPVSALNLGIMLEYTINELWAISAGARFNKRGYKFKIKGEGSDEDLQFDLEFDVRGEYKLKTIEIPLTARYAFSDQSYVHGGILLGWGRRKSAESEVTYFSEVKINGEVEESLSDDWEDKEDLPNSANNPYVGLTVGIEYAIIPNTRVGIHLQNVNNFASLNIGDVNNFSLLFSAKYFFKV